MKKLPVVTIMVAARNEENNILRCLSGLENQNYPKDKLQILIGDDDSYDNTYKLIADFISNKKQFELVKIDTFQKGLAGKTNVLVQLAKKAKGEVYLYTDADVLVNPNWVSTISKLDGAGIATGVTIIEGNGLFAQLQSLEWQFTLLVMFLFSKFNIPITSLGNNLAIRKDAYLEIGGFESVGQSLVEDYTIFKKITQAKFSFKQYFEVNALGISKSVNSFAEFLDQRKRWMLGAKQLPWFLQIINYTNAFYLPFLLIGGLYFGQICLYIWVIRFGVVTFFSLIGIFRLKQFHNLIAVIFFDLYLGIIYPVMLLNDLLNTNLKWKDRTY